MKKAYSGKHLMSFQVRDNWCKWPDLILDLYIKVYIIFNPQGDLIFVQFWDKITHYVCTKTIFHACYMELAAGILAFSVYTVTFMHNTQANVIYLQAMISPINKVYVTLLVIKRIICNIQLARSEEFSTWNPVDYSFIGHADSKALEEQLIINWFGTEIYSSFQKKMLLRCT